MCWHVTEFEEGGVVRHVHDLLFVQDIVTGGSSRFCGSLKAPSEMNLSYEVEVSQLTSGSTKVNI